MTTLGRQLVGARFTRLRESINYATRAQISVLHWYCIWHVTAGRLGDRGLNLNRSGSGWWPRIN